VTANSTNTSSSSRAIRAPARGEGDLFSDPWRAYTALSLLREAARRYTSSVGACLPLSVAFAALGLAVGAALTYVVTTFGGVTAPAELARIQVSSALLVMLLMTPAGLARTTREILRGAGVTDPVPRVRYVRLAGAGLSLAIPSAVLVSAFPIGVAALFFYIWWMFAPHASLLEGDGGRTALRRSRTLFVGEFSSTALPVVITFALVLIALTMAQRLVPPGPKGFVLSESGEYVRELTEGETYNPKTRMLFLPAAPVDPADPRAPSEPADPADGMDAPAGKHQSMPPEIAYDAEAGTLTLAAPDPVPLSTALLWAGPPLLLAVLLDPIRWYVITLLYFNLRLRREGLTVAELREELIEAHGEAYSEDHGVDPSEETA
jgi:hypothetical protein